MTIIINHNYPFDVFLVLSSSVDSKNNINKENAEHCSKGNRILKNIGIEHFVKVDGIRRWEEATYKEISERILARLVRISFW